MHSFPIIPVEEFSIKEKLGQGTFGNVYRAESQHPKKSIVAIKQFKSENNNMLHEAEMLQQCQSSNVVIFYGLYGENQGIVMEYSTKGSLYSSLKNENLNWEIKFQIGIAIGEGIEYLHGRNILHRDLKSHNIVLDLNYKAKLCDFGTAEYEDKCTTENSWVGTKRWCPPERFAGNFISKKSSDVYSYGMILWEMTPKSYKVPFTYINNGEISAWIAGGNKETFLMKCPLETDIKKCWKDVADRPEVAKVIESLKATTETLTKSGFFAKAVNPIRITDDRNRIQIKFLR